MLRFLLYVGVLFNVFLIVFTTDTETREQNDESSSEESYYEEASSEAEAYSSSCTIYQPPTPLCEGNEVYSNCANGLCQLRDCTQYGQPIPFCPRFDRTKCEGGCVCKSKYLRNPQGVCVPQDECPSYLCLKVNHEVYSNCTNGGNQARNCSQAGLPVRCKNVAPENCIRGCVCEEGYLRAEDGTCILAKDCQSCNGDPNAYVSQCSNNCPNQCSYLNKTQYVCPAYCAPGCQCKKGFVLDDNTGKCVLPEQCTKLCSKDNHEVYSDCTNSGCEARNCSQVGLPIPCVKIRPENCIKGCTCEEGYLRADDGTCIPAKDCPIVCRGKNEVYSTCTNGGCGAKQCSQLGYKVPCVDYNSDACVKGCACIDGYVRDDKGQCIPSNQCPSCGGDPNAEPGCSINCGRHCSTYMDKRPICPLRPCFINECQCRPDYVFDDNIGKCVLPKDCTPVCKNNEVFSNCTNGICDAKNCSQLGHPVPCVKLDPAYCKKGCVCQPGYLRADNGTCIPKDQCPVVCKENEVYSNCTNGGCGAKSCDQLGFPVPCVDYNSDKCVKGCACINGYVRDNSGKCIPSDQCPSCGGDVNAQPGCGINCGRHCSNYKNKHPICPRIACVINRCDCKKDYVYDDNLKKCVLPKDCTPTCQINEVFSKCANGRCIPQTCANRDSTIRCTSLNPAACKPGCVCQDKYLRAENGTCIPEDQCPPKSQPNEAYSNCSNGICKIQYCSQYGSPPMFCKRFDMSQCKGGYICKNKYLRNSDGICIPQNKCPEANPGSNTCGDDSDDGADVNCTEALQRLLEGNTAFTGNFLSVIVKKNIGKSAVMSPFSVLMPMGKLVLGSKKGESYNQLMSILNLKSKTEVRCTFPELIRTYKAQNESQLDLASKVYVNENVILKEKFKNDTKDVFYAETQNIDFSNANQAADTINKWVEEQTRSRIKNLVAPSMFSSDTRLVLANAIYFLGAWVKQFDPKQTRKGDFYKIDTDSVQKDFMYRKGSFKYANISSIDAKALQITYKGGNCTYVVFLPNAINGYVDLVEKLRDPAVFNGALKQLSYTSVVVELPRYETTTSIDLSDVWKQLNVTDIFDASKSDLDEMVEGGEKLAVTSAVHKAAITVDEVGTEAAAANAVVVGVTAVFQQTYFTADHSFVYYILLHDTPVFCGVFTGE